MPALTSPNAALPLHSTRCFELLRVPGFGHGRPHRLHDGILVNAKHPQQLSWLPAAGHVGHSQASDGDAGLAHDSGTHGLANATCGERADTALIECPSTEQPHSVCVCLSKGPCKLQPPFPGLGKHQSHVSEWANCEMKTLSCIKGTLRTSRLPFLRYSAISSSTHLPLKGTGLSASSHHLSISHQESGLKIHLD